MLLDKERLQNFQSEVIATLEGKKFVDVPYYRYLYSPSEELIYLNEFEHFCHILKNKGYSAETIYMSEILIKGLKNLDFLSDSVIKKEEEEFLEIEKNLQNELVNEVVEILHQHLEGKDISHCAILLRLGSLFPFVNVSRLLAKSEGRLKCTLILPYPGKKDGEMLGYHGDRSYYRGKVF